MIDHRAQPVATLADANPQDKQDLLALVARTHGHAYAQQAATEADMQISNAEWQAVLDWQAARDDAKALPEGHPGQIEAFERAIELKAAIRPELIAHLDSERLRAAA